MRNKRKGKTYHRNSSKKDWPLASSSNLNIIRLASFHDCLSITFILVILIASAVEKERKRVYIYKPYTALTITWEIAYRKLGQIEGNICLNVQGSSVLPREVFQCKNSLVSVFVVISLGKIRFTQYTWRNEYTIQILFHICCKTTFYSVDIFARHYAHCLFILLSHKYALRSIATNKLLYFMKAKSNAH